jgi:8-oxo-dGTP diphosphatase
VSRPRRARVVAALIAHPSDAGRFLVQQRLPHQSRANLWEFPGGKVEPAESDEAALARECREELDVELAVGRRLWSTVHRYTDLEVELLLHAARIVSGEAKAIGAQTIRYATPVEMQQLPFCEADLPLIDALARGELAK